MAHKIDRILHAVAEMPWAIQPAKLEAMLELLELRAGGVEIDGVAAAAPREVATAGKVAILPLFGVVAQRMNMMTEFSGGTSTEKFGAQFDALLANGDVRAIVLDVDSPGGSVYGVPELARKIAAARGQKRVVAIANSLMASAAYWIASAADEVWVTPSGEAGSIGVVTMLPDVSQANEKLGVKYNVISAGKYKTEGNPHEPLNDDARAAIQSRVDEYYDMFVKAVAKHRSASPAAVKDGFGQGRVLGATQAVNEKLADRVGTLDELIEKLQPRSTGTGSRRALLERRQALAERLD